MDIDSLLFIVASEQQHLGGRYSDSGEDQGRYNDNYNDDYDDVLDENEVIDETVREGRAFVQSFKRKRNYYDYNENYSQNSVDDDGQR